MTSGSRWPQRGQVMIERAAGGGAPLGSGSFSDGDTA
jgi:hypothetical protein